MSSARDLFHDPATVRHIARLARLELDDATLARLAQDLGDVLGHVAQLEAVPTEGVPPTVLSGDATRFREPGQRRTMADGENVANAPDREGAAFRVPKVL